MSSPLPLFFQLHSLVSDSSGNTSVVEQRVLDLYDELYRWYVLKVRKSHRF